MFFQFNNEGVYIPYKEYNEEIFNIIISLGFNKTGDITKYRYLNYNLSFQDEYIYKLLDKDYMDRSVESIGNKILDTFETVNKSSKLKKLLS